MAAELAFWDSSGLVLLVTHQRATPAARAIRRAFPRFVVWWGARLEVRSAIARLRRDGLLDPVGAAQAISKLEALCSGVAEVAPSREVRARAEQLTGVHDVRAADALQLSAALEWCTERPRGRVLVCFDKRLAVAARDAGFDVRP